MLADWLYDLIPVAASIVKYHVNVCVVGITLVFTEKEAATEYVPAVAVVPVICIHALEPPLKLPLAGLVVYANPDGKPVTERIVASLIVAKPPTDVPSVNWISLE